MQNNFAKLKDMSGSFAFEIELPDSVEDWDLAEDGTVTPATATISFNSEVNSAISIYTLTRINDDEDFFIDAGYGFAADNYPLDDVEDWHAITAEKASYVFKYRHTDPITYEVLSANVGLEDGTTHEVVMSVTARSGMGVSYALTAASNPTFIEDLVKSISEMREDESNLTE